jgi:dsDNA-binding SOS-regulon protein
MALFAKTAKVSITREKIFTADDLSEFECSSSLNEEEQTESLIEWMEENRDELGIGDDEEFEIILSEFDGVEDDEEDGDIDEEDDEDEEG